MAEITPEEVRRIARLARLELGEAEVVSLAAETTRVLEYLAVLSEVDVSGVEVGARDATLLRPDVPKPSLDPALAVAGAPRAEGSEFVVPKVVG